MWGIGGAPAERASIARVSTSAPARLAARLLPSSVAPTARRRGLLLGALFLLAFVIEGFTLRHGLDPTDEGIALQAARRVAQGQIPYRDFTWAYGPAEPYTLAALVKLFGVSVWPWRVLRTLADAGIAVVCYLLVERRVPRALSLAVWLTVACGLAAPRTPNPYPFALLPVLLSLLLLSRARPSGRAIGVSTVLIAVAAAFRFDIALYGLSAGGAMLVGADLRRALAYCAAGLALGALVYLPFAIIVGPGPLYQAVIGHSVDTRAYWTLPFPLDFQGPPGAGFAQTVVDFLHFYACLACVVGLAAIVAGSLWASGRRRPLPGLLLGLVIFAGGMLVYLLSRPDVAHAHPLLVVVAPGLALVAVALERPLRILCLVPLAALLAYGLSERLWALTNSPPGTAQTVLHIPVADGIIVDSPQEAAGTERMVAIVDARVPPGQPIYVLPRESDLVTKADPLVYVLTERNNPTRVDFGLQTDARSQAQIVRQLARLRLPVLVRWTDPGSSLPEPNLRGIPSGVHTVDAWVAAHYRPLADLYHYEVLVPR